MMKNHSPHIHLERTLAIIKPEAFSYANEIEEKILKNGFSILQKIKMQLSPENASEFYANQYGAPYFSSLILYMSSGPIVVLVLAKENAITLWKELIGPSNSLKAKVTSPECLRAIYGTDDQQNAVHGSDSFTSAEREIRFFFPETIIEPIPVRLAAKEYLSRNVNPTLLKGLTELCKQKPNDPVIWLADWLMENNPNKPKVTYQHVIEN